MKNLAQRGFLINKPFSEMCCSIHIAPEQKARTTYDNILRLADDPDVKDVIKFLRARELVHYQRFGESLRLATEKLDCKNYYAFNPNFDKKQANAAAQKRVRNYR